MVDTASTFSAVTMVLVLARITGMCVTSGVLGHIAVPRMVRYFICVVMSLAVMGSVELSPAAARGDYWLVISVGGEFLLGAVIGYAAGLVLMGIELGAVHVSSQMGLSLGEMFNPVSPSAGGSVRSFYRILAIVVFFGIGGHRVLIGTVLRTFASVPPAGIWDCNSMFVMVISVLTISFALALKVALPILIALLMATVAMGLLQRSLPQCNILSTGLPIRVIVGLVVLALSLSAVGSLMEAGLEQAWLQVTTVFQVVG